MSTEGFNFENRGSMVGVVRFLLFCLACIARCGGTNPHNAPSLLVSGMWDDLQKFAPKFWAGPDAKGGVGGAETGAVAAGARVFSSNFDVNRPLPSDEELRAIEAENDRLARCFFFFFNLVIDLR